MLTNQTRKILAKTKPTAFKQANTLRCDLHYDSLRLLDSGISLEGLKFQVVKFGFCRM